MPSVRGNIADSATQRAAYHRSVDPTLAVGIAGLIGAITGAAAVLAFRVSERAQLRTDVPASATAYRPALPPGAADVLAVLRQWAVVLGPDDVIVRSSPSAQAYGLVRGDRLAVAELLALVHHLRRSGEIQQADFDLPRGPLGDGTFAVSARVAPLSGGLVLVLVEDRTQAQRVDAMRRDFVANVSHELKTPVAALALLAEAMQEAPEDPDAVRRFAGRMQQESLRLSALVQDLIDLSRLEATDPLIPADRVSIDEVVSTAVDQLRLAAQQRSITLVTGGQRGLQVLGDEGQLITALRNLIDNALSYSPEQTRVGIGVRRSGNLVEICVADQGLGIPEPDQARIFERFYRIDPARSRRTGGTGLGLAIVKHITTNHGGEVSVWSAEGAGSTFTLRLPLAAPTRAPSSKSVMSI
jgi:two-component system, OmpR family, sensor histidine kinase SenX3